MNLFRGKKVDWCGHQPRTKIGILNKQAPRIVNTKTIQIVVPCLSVNNNTFTLPWFSRLYYFDSVINENLNHPFKTPFDYVFGNIDVSAVGNLKYSNSGNLNEVKSYYSHRKICVPTGWGVQAPFIAQTGIGISEQGVCFLAKVIYEQDYSDIQFSSIIPKKNKPNYGFSHISNYGVTHTGTSYISVIQKTNKNNYGRFENNDQSFSIIYQRNTFADKTLELHLSKQEIIDIQALINSNKGTGNSDLNVDYHELRFIFEPFEGAKVSNNDNFYFGKAIIKLYGKDNQFNNKVITNLKQTPSSSQLFINVREDWSTFSSVSFAALTDNSLKSLIDDNPYPEFKVISSDTNETTLVSILKEILHVNKKYTFSQDFLPKHLTKNFISVWRRYYYGFFDKSDDNRFTSKAALIRRVMRYDFNFEPFDMAIPNAYDNIFFNNTIYNTYVGALLFNPFAQKVKDFLFSSASENSLHDNPSPYIIVPDPNDTSLPQKTHRIDLGHLLYSLDGLINDYSNTHDHYKALSLNYSNDFAGYIADFVPAAAERRLYTHNVLGWKGFHYPKREDVTMERLYEISAPKADLLSDVDAFGLFNVYRYFNSNPNSNLLPIINNSRVLTAAFLFEYYYNPNFVVGDTTNYPIQSNYKLRWLNFCRGFGENGAMVETPNPAGHELVYQGFISKNTTGKYEWVANLNPNGTEHQSVAKLRKRAEAFAHFWYQIQNNQQAIGGVLWGGNYENNWVILKFAADLLKNNSNKIIRFEREGHLSLNFELSNYLNGNYTDSSELDYVLDVFLEYVKSNFQIEQTKNNY